MTDIVLEARPADHTRMQIQGQINRLKVEIGHLAANRQRMDEGYRRKTLALRRLEAELASSAPALARVA